MEREKLEDLLDTGNLQQAKLNRIVLNAIEEEKFVSRKLYEFEERSPSFGNRLADALAIFGGSWKFMLVFALFLIAWMLINTLLLSRPFDAFPFHSSESFFICSCSLTGSSNHDEPEPERRKRQKKGC